MLCTSHRGGPEETGLVNATMPVSPVITLPVITLKDVSKHFQRTVALHHVEYTRRYADRVLGLRAGALVFDDVPPALTDAALQNLFGAAPLQSAQPASTAIRETTWIASS